jgi:hypothetical protein
MNSSSPSPSRPSALWKRLEEPLMVLVVHFIIAICGIVFIELTEKLLELLHLESRPVPLIHVTLSDWMFDIDVLTASIVMLVGSVKAAIEPWKKAT